MRAVVQRVLEASVEVDGHIVGQIGPGLLILLGVRHGDTLAEVRLVAAKCLDLRIFEDAEGKMNRSVRDLGGSLLVVSQFTLYGDCRKGNRPSYITAAAPEKGREFYERLAAELRQLGHEVYTGVFGADMLVELQNDGPVTLLLESEGRTAP